MSVATASMSRKYGYRTRGGWTDPCVATDRVTHILMMNLESADSLHYYWIFHQAPWRLLVPQLSLI